MKVFDIFYEVIELLFVIFCHIDLFQKLKEQGNAKALVIDLANGMIAMLSFLDDVDGAVMKLRVTKETVKDMFQLMEKVSDFAVQITEKPVLQGM